MSVEVPPIETDDQLRRLGEVLIGVRDLDWWDKVDDRIDVYFRSRGVTPPACRFQYTMGHGWTVVYDDDYELKMRGFHTTEMLGEMLDRLELPLSHQPEKIETELRAAALEGTWIGDGGPDYEQGLVRFCACLGYDLHVVRSSDDIPDVPRDFPEALHIKDSIWCVDLSLDEGFLWHEAGHALLAEVQNWGMRTSGIHWVFGNQYSSEDMACSAAGAIMVAFGVPKEQQYSINSFVEHYPTEDGNQMKDHLAWCQILTVLLRDGIDAARALYRDMGID